MPDINAGKLLITGIGCISAAGQNLSQTLPAFINKQRRGGQATHLDTSLQYPVFEVNDLPGQYRIKGGRTLGLAWCAARQAMKEAELDDLSAFRVGVCLGTTVASQLNDLDFYRAYRETGSAPMEAVDQYLKGNLAEFIRNKIGATGPAFTVVNACSSGADAIGAAASWLRNGLCDIAIAGGADELNRIPLCGFGSLGIFSHELCRPFDKNRQGLNLGEGAGVLIMETEIGAAKRGISPQESISLRGYGSASDAYHLTTPRPDGSGLSAAIDRAIREAKIETHDISFVNAHGTGTRDNDLVEGKVLGDWFGPGVKVLSTKGYTGHTLGGAGGIEAVFTVAGLREGWIPASIGWKERDEKIPITPVREKTALKGQFALSTSLAFGGSNAALIFGKDI